MKNTLLNKSMLGLVAVLAASQMHAQTQISGTTAQASSVSFTNSISSSFSGKTDMKNVGKGLGGISSYDITDSFGCSFAAAPNLELSAGITYGSTFFNMEHENSSPMVKRLQSVSTNVGAKLMIDDEWSVMGGLGTGFYNSGTGINSHGLGFNGGAGVMKSFGENLIVVVGFGFDSLAKNKILPGFGIQYVYSPEWTISLGYPETSVTWSASEKFKLSMLLEGSFASYYVRSEDITAERNTKPVGDSKMQYDDFRAGLRASYDISECMSISATAGYLLYREFDFHEKDYKLESDSGAPYGSISFTAKF